MKRDGNKCIYCGNEAVTVDHVIPFSKGGKTMPSNGVACCRKCNYNKRGSLAHEYVVEGMTYLSKIGEDLDTGHIQPGEFLHMNPRTIPEDSNSLVEQLFWPDKLAA